MAGVLLAGAPALVPCVVAQVDVIPAAVEASLPAGQQGEVALVVTNENAAPADLYAVPLPEEGVPEDVGELLFHTDPGTVHDAWDLTMTPDGRLFAATYGGGGGTREYTSELALVREFDSPHLGFSSYTTGLAWMLPEHAPPGYPEGTLWWMDVEVDPDGPVIHVDTIFLIEGGLDGNETGRMVELIVGPGHPPHDRGVPLGLAYNAEEELFYYVDIVNEDIYAIDVEGTVAEGYPVPLTDYDDGSQEAFPINSDIDATRGADGGTYLEAGFVQRGEDEYSRVVVVDRWGRNTGVETSLGDLTAPDGEGPLVQVNGALRSRLDPPVMYPPDRKSVV